MMKWGCFMGGNKRSMGLKTKIVISTLVPVIISFIIISSALFVSLFHSFQDTTKADFLLISEKYADSFRRKINDATDYLSIVGNTLELQVASGTADREIMQRTILHVFDNYRLIDGSSVYFEQDMYDGRDAEYIGSKYGTKESGKICYYFYVDENGKTAYMPEAMENEIEFELPHYTDAKKANKPIYTKPVAYEVNGKNIPMFTITYPVNDGNNRFIGAVTVDLFLEEIYAQLKSEKIYETGYIIIANDKGHIVYSPRFEDIGKTREEAGLNYPLPAKNETSVFFNAKSILNGKDTFIVIRSIYVPQLDSFFYISVAAPTEEINAGVTSLTSALIIFAIIVTFLIAVIIFDQIDKILAPIKDLTENVDKIAGGDYHTRIKGNYSGEFAIVKDSVNAMADSIESYVEESKNSLNILKNILDGLDAYIYVTVPETGEILFINEYMKNHFNIRGDGVGQYCYKIFQDGMDEKCEFCPCFQLDKEPDKPVVWEEHNTVTKRDYRNTDCYIDWVGGVKAHLQHSVDITDLKTVMNDKLEAERAALEMKHEKEKAEEAARAKNDFLAKMSHEIRTPMNAVMGMSELILRRELPQDVYENALVIKTASMNLLSIINDILDFSKIESGMLEIVETEYLLPSLINDVISIIRVRLMDKPIQFVASVDPNIPSLLTGDEVRIRQTLTNLLSNSVKYTKEGYISLSVTGEVIGNTVTLTIDISDSGIGVKEEDIGKLFGDFVQIDMVKNKGIEGTGLGLAISRNLCRMMGGDITVRSEYGKGSTFTVTLPQKFEKYEPFATVDESKKKPVLIYETRQLYRDSVAWTLGKLGVEYKIVESISQLFENLEKYSFVFVSSFLYGSVSPALLNLDNPPRLVVLSDITEAFAPKDARILSVPVHPLSIANVLNDIDQAAAENLPVGASFIAPDAKVLVVDDITANLKVCEGLLSPYEMKVTLCGSGREAIEIVTANRYDLVFMDHMMPEMDGIETTGHIREKKGKYYKSLPIVALTANAVSGVREMFIQNGMNDFLAKPIETSKLDSILEKWIPKDKQKNASTSELLEEENEFVETLRAVPELSVDNALAIVGGSTKIYARMVRLSVDLLPENISKLESLIDTDLTNYSIEVHGIKGVLNNIGAYNLGKTAFELEVLSKSGDFYACKEIHPGFIERLIEFSDSMTALIKETQSDDDKQEGDRSLLLEAVPKMKEAVEFFDNTLGLDVISSVNGFTYEQPIDKTVEDLTRAFECFDFDKAEELINKLEDELDAG